ncbi:MAG TPA: pitrilysin family protein [Burkholderiaceae bacterium]|nr:pitrilysin family protein [Burkholderiaceae bacterium]
MTTRLPSARLRRPRPAAAAFAAWLTVMLLWLVAAAPAPAQSLPIEHWTTSSGARVLFVHAPAIPMLDVSIDFDAGGRHVARAKAGLASMTNGMMARGAGELSEFEIAERFADLGAIRGGGAGDDRASITLRTLTSQPELDRAVELIELIITRPTFPADVLAREQQRIVQSLREAEIRPETISRRAFSALLYPEHPYGNEPTPQTVAAIVRDDLVEFHRRNYSAPRAVVSMIGAISRSQAERIAEQLTRGLPAGQPPPPLPPVANLEAAVERRIPHPAQQSHILIGAPAIARGDPDFFALLVGNHVLGGGGFVSRLTNEVRDKRGLAYSVYSYFAPQAQPGPFTIGLQTAREQTDTALKVVRDTLEQFVREGPTEAEVDAARSNLVGGFPLRIDSNRKILDMLAMIGFYRLPLDYLDRWTDEVQRVDRRQIVEAFQRHVHPDRLVTVVVGAGAQAADAPAAAAPSAAGTAAAGAPAN